MPYAEAIDGSVLETLCAEPGPWARDELRREHGGSVDVDDALRRLIDRGLVLRMKGGFVIASAAGRYAHQVDVERG